MDDCAWRAYDGGFFKIHGDGDKELPAYHRTQLQTAADCSIDNNTDYSDNHAPETAQAISVGLFSMIAYSIPTSAGQNSKKNPYRGDGTGLKNV